MMRRDHLTGARPTGRYMGERGKKKFISQFNASVGGYIAMGTVPVKIHLC